MIRLYEFLFNIYLLRVNKVDFDADQIFNYFRGKLFLLNKGKFILSDHVLINSKYSANPIGGQGFTSIVVEKDAILEIRKNVGISNSAIYCKKYILIEEDVLIGGDCRIYDSDFHSLDYIKRMGVKDDDIISKPVTIKRGAFLGAGVIVLKGVTIGEFCIIGAGSVVSKSIPNNEMWAGNPIQFIKNNLN